MDPRGLAASPGDRVGHERIGATQARLASFYRQHTARAEPCRHPGPSAPPGGLASPVLRAGCGPSHRSQTDREKTQLTTMVAYR